MPLHRLHKITSLSACLSIGWILGYSQISASGSEVLVNSLTTNAQQRPDVAMDAEGNYVIAYESYGHDLEGWAILGQRYYADGSERLEEFTINIMTQMNDQRSPAVAMDQFGRFSVVYMSDFSDLDGWGVHISRFDSSGFPKGESIVNTTEFGQQRNPDIAMNADGDQVVVWMNISLFGDTMSIRGQRIDSGGVYQGSEFLINTTNTDYMGYPSVAMAYDGSFVVVWQSLDQDGSGQGIFAQRYTSSGATEGSEFQVNTTTTGNQQAPDIAIDSAGNFVVVWESYGQDGDDYGIYAQQFFSNGSTNGSEFLVNATTSSNQEAPAVTMSYDGEFIITWTGHNQDGSYSGVYMQVYDSVGAAYGSESQVNSTTSDFQQFAAPAINPSASTMVIAWQDGQHNSSTSADSDDYATVMQRYTVSGTILPIELLTFEATKYDEETALLTWTTATELDNDGFFVERMSTHDYDEGWKNLGFVKGAGRSVRAIDYSFVDRDPQNGVNYYRLRQIDFDGTETLTETRLVIFETAGDLTIYPNPTSDLLYVHRSEDAGDSQMPFQLVDTFGRLVLNGTLRAPLAQIQLDHLASGPYSLKVLEDGVWEHYQVVVAQ